MGRRYSPEKSQHVMLQEHGLMLHKLNEKETFLYSRYAVLGTSTPP